jgi:O-antigen/teichoic acid export membrane protein
MTYSRRALRELRGFGGNVSATLVLFQLNQNTDNVLIGRFLGASPLGAYALAYNIILVPFSRLVAPLHDVLYPVFSRLQDDHARLSAIWLRTLRMVAAVAVPAGLGLIVVAPDAVDVIFGRRWHAAIPVVQILSGVGLLFLLQGLNSVVLQAIDRTRLLFHYALVSFLAGVTSFAIGLHWGIVGVAGCFAVVSAVIQPAYMHLTARAVGIGLRDCARALGGVLIAALIATAGVAAIHTAMVAGGVGPPLRLVIAVVFAINLYLLACLFCAGDLVDELRRFVPQRFQLRPSLGS